MNKKNLFTIRCKTSPEIYEFPQTRLDSSKVINQIYCFAQSANLYSIFLTSFVFPLFQKKRFILWKTDSNHQMFYLTGPSSVKYSRVVMKSNTTNISGVLCMLAKVFMVGRTQDTVFFKIKLNFLSYVLIAKCQKLPR